MKKTFFDKDDLKKFEEFIFALDRLLKRSTIDDLSAIWDVNFIPIIQDLIKNKKKYKTRNFFFDQEKIQREDALILLKEKFIEIEDYYIYDKAPTAYVLMLYSISLSSIFTKNKEKKINNIWKAFLKGANNSKKFKVKFIPKKFRKIFRVIKKK